MIPFAVPPIEPAATVATESQQVSSTSSRIWQFHDEHVLGTRLEILANSGSAVVAAEAASVARSEIHRLDRVFNHRRGDSEVSALNRIRHGRVSPDLFAVVQASEVWRAITRGAFDARMGELLSLWATAAQPNSAAIARVLTALRSSTINIDPMKMTIGLSSGAVLSLDAVAKGYIVDAALNAARRAVPALHGLAISVGGDLRCWGVGANSQGWCVGIPETITPAMNAPLVDSLVLHNAAIATSGRGPRDCLGNYLRSSTISPLTGQPIRDIVSASVVASHAMDADAIATACMVLSPQRSLEIVHQLEGVAARITDAQGQVHTSADWPMLQLAAAAPEQHIAQSNGQRSKKNSLPANSKWPTEWVLSIDYTAPPRQAKRNSDFRSPYMAMWITDANNKPVRTVLMVGREPDWQRDNFVWWSTNRARPVKLVEMRSLPTSISGRYGVYWTGVDDDSNPVPMGKYTLHLETSQERGKHDYRSMTLELGRDGFRTELPKVEGSGGIEVYYGHPNERFKSR
jgi:FAD:protein FMN transferase